MRNITTKQLKQLNLLQNAYPGALEAALRQTALTGGLGDATTTAAPATTDWLSSLTSALDTYITASSVPKPAAVPVPTSATATLLNQFGVTVSSMLPLLLIGGAVIAGVVLLKKKKKRA